MLNTYRDKEGYLPLSPVGLVAVVEVDDVVIVLNLLPIQC